MIPKKTLRGLINHKLKDAGVLIANRRYAAGVYLAGYALEVALKLKVCKIFKFTQGFPENKAEFVVYQNNARSQKLLAGAITQLKDIRNHDLNKLLFFSGTEYKIKLHHLNEWNLVVGWNPETRYIIKRVLKNEAVSKINAIKILIQQIL
ncbi:MAG TPA: hypothetical protein VD993_07915 [Chitinophagaceae bacterium]|nr:hypothetical protein [Chitinophagaceae bacterium]